ncbi:hypothetical protein M0R45_019029 [Rubus argutus]|uniref:FAR1 domain-containing protein n=1 Tax=Rubus argutus TaxID=59490 RepID=A0AAW1X5V3_RUBAR
MLRSDQSLIDYEIVLQKEDEASLQGEDEANLQGEHEIDLLGEDRVDLPSEDGVDLSSEDDGDVQGKEDDGENKEKTEELCNGMEFSSDESAYKAYAKYGGKNGFNVRKQKRNRNKNDVIVKLFYCCSKQGQRRINKKCEPSYSIPITRVGCKAHMSCRLQNNGKFKIVSLQQTRNHELIKTPMKHMLKINRCMSKAKKNMLMMLTCQEFQ